MPQRATSTTAETPVSSHTLQDGSRSQLWKSVLLAIGALGALALIAGLLGTDTRYGFGSLGWAPGVLLSLLSVTAVTLSAAAALSKLWARLPELSYQRWLPSAAFLILLLVALTVFALLSASEGEQLNVALLAVTLGIVAAALAVAAVLMAASSHWASTATALLLNTIALAQLLWLHEQALSRTALLLLFLTAVSLVLSLAVLLARNEGPDGAEGAANAEQRAEGSALLPPPARGHFLALAWFFISAFGLALAAVLGGVFRSQGTSPAEILTGLPLPPEPLGVAQVFAQWQLEPLGLVIVALLSLWFWARASKATSGFKKTVALISFAVALALVIIASQGPVGVYRDFLFSAASVEFLILAVLVPLLLLVASALTAPRYARTSRPEAHRIRQVASPVTTLLAGAWLLFALWGIKWTVLFADQVTGALFGAGLLVTTAGAVVLLAGAAAERRTLPVLLALLGANITLGVSWYFSDTLLLGQHYGAMGWPEQYPVLVDQQLGVWITLVVSTVVLMLLCSLSLFAQSSPRRSGRGSAQEPALKDSSKADGAASARSSAPQHHTSLDDYDRQLRAGAKARGRE